MKKNLLSKAIRPLPSPIRVLPRLRCHLPTSATLFRKKWYYGTNLQAIGFLVFHMGLIMFIFCNGLILLHVCFSCFLFILFFFFLLSCMSLFFLRLLKICISLATVDFMLPCKCLIKKKNLIWIFSQKLLTAESR